MGAGSRYQATLAGELVSGSSPAERLVLSVAQAAEALGVSDDLVYELTERGEIPCVRIGRRKLIPRRAVELLLDSALSDFDPRTLRAVLGMRSRDPHEGIPDASVIDEFGAG